MYLTAQRVVTPNRDRQGINAFLHLHARTLGEDPPFMPSYDVVTTREPGTIVLKDCPIPPGGNDVRSFLDVVALDECGYEEIARALDRFEGVVSSTPPGDLAREDQDGGMALGFHAQYGIGDAQLEEYRELRGRLLELLRRHEAREAA